MGAQVVSQDIVVNYIKHAMARTTYDYYDTIHQWTREPRNYEMRLNEKLNALKAATPEICNGVPLDDIIRGLLWHAVYKPFWNEHAKTHEPSWSWASLTQRVGWPGYRMSNKEDDLVRVEVVRIGNARLVDTGTVNMYGEVSKTTENPLQVMHDPQQGNQLALVGCLAVAEFSLLDDTLRKGILRGKGMLKTLSCSMDCDFSARKVLVLQMLTRKTSSGTWCSHFMVLESAHELDVAIQNEDEGKSLLINRAETGDSPRGTRIGESIRLEHPAQGAASPGDSFRILRRIGTARIRHRDRDLRVVTQTRRETIVIV